MSFAAIAVALTLGLGLPKYADDSLIEALIQDLGATEYAQRESASAELEKRGLEALPQLREALKSSDPEVRDRAAELVRKISTLNPEAAYASSVRLDQEETALDEVVKEVSSQTGVRIELTGNSDKVVTLKEANPVPFWKAVDRVCQAGDLRIPTNVLNALMIRPGNNPFRIQEIEGLNCLMLSPGKPVSYPSFYSGYYCARLMKIRGVFDQDEMLSFGDDSEEVNKPIDLEGRSQILEIAVLGKPGAKLEPNGSVSKIKVVDERGRDLCGDANANQDVELLFRRGRRGFRGRLGGANMVISNEISGQLGILTYRIPVRMPDDPPSRAFKLVQGMAPIVITTESEPIFIEIGESLGKKIETPAASIEIQSVETDKDTDTIKVCAVFTSKPSHLRASQEPALFSPPADLDPNRDRFVFEDRQGRTIVPFASFGQDNERITNYEWHFRGKPDNVPTKMTVQIMNRQETEIAFEFRDVLVPRAKN